MADRKKAMQVTCKPVKLTWIPGHYNFDGKDEAARLSTEGSALIMTVLNLLRILLSRLEKPQIKIGIHGKTTHQIVAPH